MKPFTKLAILVFAIVAVAHLSRLVCGFSVIVWGIVLPQWISLPGFAISAGLALMLWRESRAT